VSAQVRSFLALVHEVIVEERVVFAASMEVVRGQGYREHRHFGFQLHCIRPLTTDWATNSCR
jgi:hypothetical protein